MIKVFGHLNPDTDSTCSAIGMAWYLSEIKKTPATPHLLGPINKEARFALEHFKQPVPQLLEDINEGDQIAIIDTNNPEELPDFIRKGQLKQLVDHHKLTGGLSTPEPISLTIRPVACTATLIWNLIEEAGVHDLPKQIAGLLLAAIISDSLKFSSPTTTEEDRKAAAALQKLADISIDDLAEGLFAAKSDLSGLTPRDLLLSDSKIFTLGSKKLRVSSLETVRPAAALEMKDELLKAMESLKKEESTDGLFFFVVDILNNSADLVAAGFEQETAVKAFSASFENNIAHLPGIVSRKKQIIPALEKVLAP